MYDNDSLYNAIEKMKLYQLENITVIKDDFSILGTLCRKKVKEMFEKNLNDNIFSLKNIKISKTFEKFDAPIMLYPKSTISNAFYLMDHFNIKCMPIINLPWEKKIVGFLWINDILSIEKKYLEIPV